VFFTALGKEGKKTCCFSLFLVPVFSLPCCGWGGGFPLQNDAVMGWLCCGRNCSTEEEEEEEEGIVVETEAKKDAERNKKEITSSKKRKTKKCCIVFVVISVSFKYSSKLLVLETLNLFV
jgi:hypothetical protein